MLHISKRTRISYPLWEVQEAQVWKTAGEEWVREVWVGEEEQFMRAGEMSVMLLLLRAHKLGRVAQKKQKKRKAFARGTKLCPGACPSLPLNLVGRQKGGAKLNY